MKHKILVILGTLALVSVLLLGSIKASWAVQKMSDFVISHPAGAVLAQFANRTRVRSWNALSQVPVVGCQQQPKMYPPQPNIETAFVAGQLTLDRFRRPSIAPAALPERPFNPRSRYSTRVPLAYFQPREEIALAYPTNFGERYRQDIGSQPVNNSPIIVLHETVGAGWQAVQSFQTPHLRDEDQASYHTLIKRDGAVFYLVPPDKRAFGAGNSVFAGESVKTNRLYPPSVNNFAYHISFETPPDGRGNGNFHSGYTEAQYQSAAWLIAKTSVPEERITTHKAVDRSGTRRDPRSFQGDKLLQLLSSFPKTQDIAIGCPAVQSEERPY
jgi:N-acetyl-anhydromuramyl-L-alanine amidase AmpD